MVSIGHDSRLIVVVGNHCSHLSLVSDTEWLHDRVTRGYSDTMSSYIVHQIVDVRVSNRDQLGPRGDASICKGIGDGMTSISESWTQLLSRYTEQSEESYLQLPMIGVND